MKSATCWAVAVGFEGFGQFGQLVGNFAGDAGGLAAGVERQRVEPDLAQALLDPAGSALAG